MRSNKVILFIDSFKKGGAERVCSNYASILFNHNVDVEIWTYNIGDKKIHIEKGSRVVQGVFVKYYTTVDDKPARKSRTGLFGSTGK